MFCFFLALLRAVARIILVIAILSFFVLIMLALICDLGGGFAYLIMVLAVILILGAICGRA